jgi:hypothetical protein
MLEDRGSVDNIKIVTVQVSKVKIEIYQHSANHYAMKICGGEKVYFHVFITSALDVEEWSASRPDRFALKEYTSGTHLEKPYNRSGCIREKGFASAENGTPILRSFKPQPNRCWDTI